MCSYMVKVFSSSSRRHSYVLKSNLDSWEGLCKLSRRREDVFSFKFVLMGMSVVL